jgi:signal transduction histidine kinase/CheY-like chemotaxis protein
MASLIEIETQRSYSVGAHTMIGRDDSCEVRIDDPMVSASHAEITRSPDGTFKLRDLGSRRGTFVGSKKVSETRLKDGDELMIGPMRLRFEENEAGAPDDSEELIRLRAIVELGRAIGVEHDLERLLSRVLETCFELLESDRGAIVIYQPHSKAPYLTVTRRRDGDQTPFAVSTSVLGEVMVTHKPYLQTELDSDGVLKRSQSLSANGVRSVMAVPLRYEADETEWLGLIQLDSRAIANVFRPRDLDLLEAIAGPTALAIKNAMLVRQVQTVISDEWRRFERVVRDLPLGVVVLDDQRRCVMVNQWVSAREAEVGALRPGTIAETVAGMPSDQLIGGDLRTQTTTDSDRIYSLAANTSADGRETVIVVNDITEERERQNQVAHRDRVALIGQLAGGVAHDFNNLLHVILTYANMLEESIQDPDLRDDAHQITHAATSAAELTRQLLTFSRRELVKPKVVDVPHVVQGMEKMLIRTLGPQVEFVTAIGPRIPRILIDTAQLEQILMNLLVNARDAMLGKGRVRLTIGTYDLDVDRANQRALVPGRYVSIEVSDAGSGMTPEVAERIFEPYFTTKARGKGTGLGLATVHGIVQQGRGDITVESTLGQGTTFRIILPATDQLGDEARPFGGGDSGGGTVLVVDDDDDVRRVTERILRNGGYQVLSASSGQDALAVSRAYAGTIHLLLTDLVMPGMSGRELARDLSLERPDARVIFMSGYHQHAPIANSQFIPKPFGRSDLLEKVRSTLMRDRADISS